MVKNSIIWIIGSTIALASGLSALGAVAQDKAPALAVTLYPMNGFSAENIASESTKISIAENSGQFPNHNGPKATDFARKAFLAEPITPEAIAVLAFGEADQNKRKLMNEALLLSRRQPLVTAWMIADSGARDDMSALLSHYDTMLRINRSAAPVIISLMADTLANDDFVTPFASLLRKQPPWEPRFWGAVAGKREAIGNAARLRVMLYKPNESGESYRDEKLIDALVNNKQFEAAETLYSLLVGRKDASSLLKNGSFEAESKYPPIDWKLFSTGEYGAVVTDGKLELSAIRNSGGLFAQQLVKLPATVMTMSIKFSDSMADNARIVVSLKCAQTIQNVPQPIRISLFRDITNLQIDNSRSECSFYWLDINGRASETGDGFDVALDSISLR